MPGSTFGRLSVIIGVYSSMKLEASCVVSSEINLSFDLFSVFQFDLKSVQTDIIVDF